MNLTPARTGLLAAAIIATAGIALFSMGHVLICNGVVKLLHFDVSSENSQHLIDWYTPSHLIHGFLLYWMFWLLSRIVLLSPAMRLILALALGASWEVIENTEFVINRYREMMISLDYYGDSVVNSVSDILAVLLGYVMAARLPVWLILVIAISLELLVGLVAIRENVTLNTLSFVWLDVIQKWQQAR